MWCLPRFSSVSLTNHWNSELNKPFPHIYRPVMESGATDTPVLLGYCAPSLGFALYSFIPSFTLFSVYPYTGKVTRMWKMSSSCTIICQIYRRQMLFILFYFIFLIFVFPCIIIMGLLRPAWCKLFSVILLHFFLYMFRMWYTSILRSDIKCTCRWYR